MNQLIPPPGMEPVLPDWVTPTEAIREWVDLMNTCDRLLMSNLRQEIGPDGDLQHAYRECVAMQMEDHDRMIARLSEKLYAKQSSGG